jgi:hypothetical protein
MKQVKSSRSYSSRLSPVQTQVLEKLRNGYELKSHGRFGQCWLQQGDEKIMVARQTVASLVNHGFLQAQSTASGICYFVLAEEQMAAVA